MYLTKGHLLDLPVPTSFTNVDHNILGLMEKQHKAKTTTDTIKSEAIGFAIIINLYIPSRYYHVTHPPPLL